MAAAAKGGVAMELEKMSVEQVKAIKEQTDLEVNLLQDSLNNIRSATSRLESASSALHDLSLRPHGHPMLVPPHRLPLRPRHPRRLRQGPRRRRHRLLHRENDGRRQGLLRAQDQSAQVQFRSAHRGGIKKEKHSR
ncbi:hypothetical protein NL676_004316 [Syzygium grande]|nr:hypothetical protein NL676_004316 [Syzygium grande]